MSLTMQCPPTHGYSVWGGGLTIYHYVGVSSHTFMSRIRRQIQQVARPDVGLRLIMAKVRNTNVKMRAENHLLHDWARF